jgi:hypothetical protein
VRTSTLIFTFFCACTLACSSLPHSDRASDTNALLALHESGMQAHRDNNVDALLAGAVSDFVVANRGSIDHPTRDEQRAHFADYLHRTRFSIYRDLVPPIVKVSNDGSLGWVLVQVEARGEQTSDSGTIKPLAFVSAWIELYEKRNGRWVSIGNVSNFKP